MGVSTSFKGVSEGFPKSIEGFQGLFKGLQGYGRHSKGFKGIQRNSPGFLGRLRRISGIQRCSMLLLGGFIKLEWNPSKASWIPSKHLRKPPKTTWNFLNPSETHQNPLVPLESFLNPHLMKLFWYLQRLHYSLGIAWIWAWLTTHDYYSSIARPQGIIEISRGLAGIFSV